MSLDVKEMNKLPLFRKRIIRIIAVVLGVIWMAIIFSFSSKEAAESTQESISVSYQLVDKTSTLFGLGWDEEKIASVAATIEKGVRKTAHMTEFAILTILWGIAIDAWAPTSIDLVSKAWMGIRFERMLGLCAGCILYAASDEYHQTFVAGRTGKFSDVLIDTCGIVCGLLVVTIIVLIVRSRKVKVKAKTNLEQR